ncbi:MAG: glycosyltransferase family 39 protein [Candidatus Margulisiibacteriota bacterium]
MLKKNNAIIFLVICAGLLYFTRLGSFSLYDAAETTYGEFVKNMLNMGDWITLHYNGQIIFDKPPLYYWFVALLSKLIGFNEFTMRFWAALSGVLTVITTYLLGRKFYNEKIGLLSGIIAMTAFQFLIQSRIAELDIMLTLFFTLALYLFYLGYSTGNKRYYLYSYIPMGLAILLKGIIGFILPGFTIFLFLLFKKELGKIRELKIIPGILIITAIGLPWFLIEYLIHGKVFLDFALGFLFLSRFGGVVANHTGPWYYYILALLLGFAPWSQFLPLGFWQYIKNWKNDPELLSLCFIFPTLIVFSIAKTKLPSYILPLYPFLAIMVGKQWGDLFEGKQKKNMLISNLFFAVIVLLIFIGTMMIGNMNYSKEFVALMPHLKLLGTILAIGGILSIVLFAFNKYKLSFAAIPIMVSGITLVLISYTLPAVEPYKGTKELAQKVSAAIKPGEQIAAYDVGNRPSVVFYNSKPIVFLESEAEVREFMEKKRGYCFVMAGEYAKLNFTVYTKQGEIIYFPLFMDKKRPGKLIERYPAFAKAGELVVLH